MPKTHMFLLCFYTVLAACAIPILGAAEGQL